jgi:hypothetical protein
MGQTWKWFRLKGSPFCLRLGCKSRKINRLQKSREGRFWTFCEDRVLPISDVVPHVSAHETHQWAWKISFVTLKRLLRHNLPEADMERP